MGEGDLPALLHSPVQGSPGQPVPNTEVAQLTGDLERGGSMAEGLECLGQDLNPSHPIIPRSPC